MFDIGASEILLIVVVAIIVIGPKDMPRAMRIAGQWAGKIRRMSGHVRAGIDAMIHEAELEELEKEWQERNARIMDEHPDASPVDASSSDTGPADVDVAQADNDGAATQGASAEARVEMAATQAASTEAPDAAGMADAAGGPPPPP